MIIGDMSQQKTNFIKLTQQAHKEAVEVIINGKLVARFWDDGSVFVPGIPGKGSMYLRWKE